MAVMIPQAADLDGQPDRTVLVVMHDLWGRQRITAVLVEAGYQVLEASNGASGIRLAEQHHPNAILLGGRLPELDTVLVFDELRSRLSTRTIPVMIVDHQADPLGSLASMHIPSVN